MSDNTVIISVGTTECVWIKLGLRKAVGETNAYPADFLLCVITTRIQIISLCHCNPWLSVMGYFQD